MHIAAYLQEFSLRQSQHQQQLSAAERQTEQRQADARRQVSHTNGEYCVYIFHCFIGSLFYNLCPQLTQQQHQTRVGERECEQLRVKMQKIVDKVCGVI